MSFNRIDNSHDFAPKSVDLLIGEFGLGSKCVGDLLSAFWVYVVCLNVLFNLHNHFAEDVQLALCDLSLALLEDELLFCLKLKVKLIQLTLQQVKHFFISQLLPHDCFNLDLMSLQELSMLLYLLLVLFDVGGGLVIVFLVV